MSNINKIKVSGQTYNIQDQNATKTVELTQAEYDALPVKDLNTFYIITDSEGFDLSNYYTKSETSGATQISTALASKADKSEIPSLDGYATETWVEGKGYLTEHQDISGKLDVSAFNTYSGSVNTQLNSKASESDLNALNDTVTAHTSDSDIHVTSSEKSTWNAKSDFSGSYNDLTDKPTLFSGDYNDLSNKPTIPSKTSDLTNDSNFATSGYVDSAVSGKANSSDVYTKSQTSAATEISTALNAKADTATTYTKTEVDNAITSATSTKQDTLVSGTNIKTINNESILGSGNINIQGGGIDSGTVQTMIDESISGKADSSDVYTKSETSGATEIATALSGKQDTLSAGTNITIVDNVISAEGGGKAVSGGTNISITTGATADTINCTIPAFFHSNTVKGDIEIGSNDGVNSDYGRLVIGRRVQSRGNPFFQYSIGIGVQPDNSNKYCQLYGQNSVGIGRGFKIGSDSLYANGINNAIAIGHNATSRNDGDITLGADTTASGGSSVAIGSGATANGSDYKMNLNNQIKVTPSNQVYISNSANTSTYCLQEKIENTESALGGLSLVKLSQSEYDALATKDSNTLYVING